MSDRVHVVFEEGIDKATQNFLEEVITDYGKTVVHSEEIVNGETTILLGIKGSNGKADSYINKNTTIKTSDLFNRTDSYILSAKENIISIVGKDTDSTFFGIATLQMMLTSYEDPALRSVQIEVFLTYNIDDLLKAFTEWWVINHGKPYDICT